MNGVDRPVWILSYWIWTPGVLQKGECILTSLFWSIFFYCPCSLYIYIGLYIGTVYIVTVWWNVFAHFSGQWIIFKLDGALWNANRFPGYDHVPELPEDYVHVLTICPHDGICDRHALTCRWCKKWYMNPTHDANLVSSWAHMQNAWALTEYVYGRSAQV